MFTILKIVQTDRENAKKRHTIAQISNFELLVINTR